MDITNKLGAQMSSEAAKTAQSSSQVEPKKEAVSTAPAATGQEGDGVSADAPAKKESSGVQEPDSWSKESALKEVTKLREENKAQRLKYNEQLEKIKVELEQKNAPLKQEIDDLKKYKDELERIKLAEVDKKRNLEEKVAHREARIAELEANFNFIKAEKEKEVENFKLKLSEYEAQEAARRSIYQERLNAEIAGIPEKFREHAELIAKGAGDVSEALVAINEAKLKGLFDDKTVVVNHSVPGAKDGARATKDHLDAAANAEREKMSSNQKIASALKDIRSGNKNSAFRTG